jgi:hypothetical protein
MGYWNGHITHLYGSTMNQIREASFNPDAFEPGEMPANLTSYGLYPPFQKIKRVLYGL